MCPREEPVCISQAGSSRMLCRIGALKTRSYRPFSASIAVYLRVLRAPMRQTRVLDGSLHGGSNLAPLRRDMPHRRHDRKNGSNVCGAGKPEASYSQGKTPVSNLCDGNTDTAWGDWQSKGSVKPEPWVSWTFDEAKTLDYDLSGSLNIETQAYPRRSRSRSRRMVASSRPRRASPVMAMLASGFLLLIAAVAVFAIRRAAQ